MEGSVQRPVESGSGASLWEAALREVPEKVALFGPPAWLVAQSRRFPKEDVHVTARRVREELGIGDPQPMALPRKS